jgi:hypothetical protein
VTIATIIATATTTTTSIATAATIHRNKIRVICEFMKLPHHFKNKMFQQEETIDILYILLTKFFRDPENVFVLRKTDTKQVF